MQLVSHLFFWALFIFLIESTILIFFEDFAMTTTKFLTEQITLTVLRQQAERLEFQALPGCESKS
jgi:hypothetical protein